MIGLGSALTQVVKVQESSGEGHPGPQKGKFKEERLESAQCMGNGTVTGRASCTDCNIMSSGS